MRSPFSVRATNKVRSGPAPTNFAANGIGNWIATFRSVSSESVHLGDGIVDRHDLRIPGWQDSGRSPSPAVLPDPSFAVTRH